MQTVLIIEDDPSLLRGLKDNFEFGGYKVRTATDGERALKDALAHRPDLVILDLMLPNINGYEICRFLREEKMDMPIIMLTAKNEEADVVLGLKLGADDYVTKPFRIKELMARAESLLRRRASARQINYSFGEFQLDVSARTLRNAKEEIRLSPKEFDLLKFFLENSGKALSRDDIMSAVWGWESAVTPRSIDRFVNVLRNKIEADINHPVILQTVREFGYKFVPG